MTVALTENKLEFKNSGLMKATNAIIKARNSAVSSYLTIGEKLKEIRDGKLYKDDFGKFEDFTNEVFGLSKATAYRIISVTTRFLIPEKSEKAEKFFTGFEDTALAALLSVPMPEDEKEIDVYTETKEFCNAHYIDTTTPVSEIRQIIKDEKAARINVETVAETPLTETETDESEQTTAEKSDIKQLSDVQKDSVVNILNTIIDNAVIIRDKAISGNITERDFNIAMAMAAAMK